MRTTRMIWYWMVVRLSPRQIHRRWVRRRLASRYLRGDGLEIGALHMPVSVPACARVRYVDYETTDQLRAHHGHLGLLHLAEVGILDDAQRLATVSGGSVDFVIANHVLEHCEDPVGTIVCWLARLRAGGILYIGVPDKRRTFDRVRPLTSVEHVVRDWREGPEWSRDDHLAEHVRLLDGVSEDEVERRIVKLKASNHRIHYHVWTSHTFRDLLEHCRHSLGLPVRLEEIREVANEFIAVLRKVR